MTSAVRGAGGHVHKRRRWGSHSRPQGALRTACWLCRPSVRHASKTGWRPRPLASLPARSPGSTVSSFREGVGLAQGRRRCCPTSRGVPRAPVSPAIFPNTSWLGRWQGYLGPNRSCHPPPIPEGDLGVDLALPRPWVMKPTSRASTTGPGRLPMSAHTLSPMFWPQREADRSRDSRPHRQFLAGLRWGRGAKEQPSPWRARFGGEMGLQVKSGPSRGGAHLRRRPGRRCTLQTAEGLLGGSEESPVASGPRVPAPGRWKGASSVLGRGCLPPPPPWNGASETAEAEAGVARAVRRRRRRCQKHRPPAPGLLAPCPAGPPVGECPDV